MQGVDLLWGRRRLGHLICLAEMNPLQGIDFLLRARPDIKESIIVVRAKAHIARVDGGGACKLTRDELEDAVRDFLKDTKAKTSKRRER
eukprot:3117995-Prymnesium_polylepis.1